MKNIIEIKDMSVFYENKLVLNDLSLNIENNSYITICGKNGSGKTSFIKALFGLGLVKGDIKINDILLSEKSIKKIHNIVSIVHENPNVNLIGETVFDELKIVLKKSGFNKQNCDEKIKELSTQLKFENILSEVTTHLSEGQKQLISFAKAIISEPKILLLDESFSMMNGITKDRVIKYLKKYYKNNKCTILSVTNDMDDILYGTHVIILKDGKVLIFDKTEEVLKNEKSFKEASLNLPFMSDLSLKLKYYGLVNDPILDIDKMVKYLWK